MGSEEGSLAPPTRLRAVSDSAMRDFTGRVFRDTPHFVHGRSDLAFLRLREAQGPAAHDQRRTEWIPWPGHAPSPSAPPSAPEVPFPSHAITKFVVRSVGASMRAGVGGHPGPVWPRTHTSAKYLTWVCLGCGHGLAQRPQYRQRAARSDTGVTEQQRAHPGQPRRPASRVAPERNTRASAIPACPIAWTRLAGLDSGGAGRAGGMRHAAPAGSRSPRAT